MTDALIALVIVLAAAIPVAGVIQYAYFSVVSSAEISREFNKFGDGVDNLIWNHMHDPASHPLSALAATTLPDVTISIPEFVAADMHGQVIRFVQPLESSGKRRHGQAEIFMIRRKAP